MFLHVIEDDLLQNIDAAFREQYPYLKLVFYKNPHSEGMASDPKERLSLTTPIEEAAMFLMAGNIDISPERVVAELEADFFHKLGLCVQVARLSGDQYIVTTETDYWTLQQQNDAGRERNMPPEFDPPEEAGLLDAD